MTNPKFVIPATTYPVSVSEAVGVLRLDPLLDPVADAEQNDRLTSLIKSACEYCERLCGKTWNEKTWEYAIDDFPVTDSIVLPMATPLVEIVSIKYTDSSGVETTLAASQYIKDDFSEPGRVVLGYGLTWPSFTPYPTNAVRVRYRAGIADTSPDSPMPEYRKVAVLALVAHWWQNPEASATSVAGQPLSQAMVAAITSTLANDMLPNSF